MKQSVVDEAARRYGLAVRAFLPVQKGYRNEVHPLRLTDGRTVQITFFKPEADSLERMSRADAVSSYASHQGLPVRTRLDGRVLKLAGPTRVSHAAMYEYLPGDTIPWEAYTRAHLKLTGLALGRLHGALERYPVPGPSVVDENLALIGRMRRYFADAGVTAALRRTLGMELQAGFDGFGRLMEHARGLPSQQLHMDFVRGNLLFAPSDGRALHVDDVALSGILDFEKTAAGPPVFDVARTLAFLLVDCKYKSETAIRKVFLRSGYQKRGGRPLTVPPRLLEALVTFYLLHDFYKFLRHTPYGSLPRNEHFVRTAARLRRAGVLHYG